MNAKTIPIRWGLQVSIGIVLGAIVLTLCMNVLIFYSSRATYGIIFVILTLVVGCCLLLLPALKLLKTPERSQAMALFNKASYYPLALLMVVLVKIVI